MAKKPMPLSPPTKASADRPTMRDLAPWLVKIADSECDDNSGMTWAERIARRLFQSALRGNIRACKLIFDHIEPVPKRTVRIINPLLCESRADLNMRLGALRSDEVDRLLPSNCVSMPLDPADEPENNGKEM